jgi:hypothetical protein
MQLKNEDAPLDLSIKTAIKKEPTLKHSSSNSNSLLYSQQISNRSAEICETLPTKSLDSFVPKVFSIVAPTIGVEPTTVQQNNSTQMLNVRNLIGQSRSNSSSSSESEQRHVRDSEKIFNFNHLYQQQQQQHQQPSFRLASVPIGKNKDNCLRILENF